jgi:hypothetical protein
MRTALTLLTAMRETPMLRGGRISERRLQLTEDITSAIAAQGALPRLAKRVAFQFSLKFEEANLGDQSVWRAIGDRLRHESEYLRTTIGLVDRQIIVALPKLSAEQVEDLLKELTARDATIARTILNVALDAADPRAAAPRYLKEYHRVAKQFESIDPGIARTVANATFMASIPRAKADKYFTHFSALVARFRDDVEFARTVAKAAFRSPDPIKTANDFVTTHDAIVAELTSESAEPHIARTLAAIASLGSDPMPAARRLLKNFNQIVRFVMRTHPSIARTVALSACRAADPLTMARSYTKNYDAIVRMINRIDPQCAREVASQAFRSDNPLRWAKRYLEELHRTRLQAHARRT